MIINPAIIALTGGSLLATAFSIYAMLMGARIVCQWDPASGSAFQLKLERQTYLISTLMVYMLGFEIFSLFLFIYTADHLHTLFVGAMCAAGSLNVNAFGYPALVVKIISVLGCGIWLLVNQADSRAEDYPLIRFKYKLLFWITGVLVIAALLQIAYFKGLEAQVITSCCASVFSDNARNFASDMASLPVRCTRIAFFLSAGLHALATFRFLLTRRGGRAAGWLSAIHFVFSIVAVISFISVYYYELPTHHCPFDLLQAHYHYIGYPLYVALFTFAIFGMGNGVLAHFANMPGLGPVLPPLLRRHAWISLAAGLLFAAMAAYPMIFSDFMLVVS